MVGVLGMCWIGADASAQEPARQTTQANNCPNPCATINKLPWCWRRNCFKDKPQATTPMVPSLDNNIVNIVDISVIPSN
jgi:hypothetical protein